MAKLWQKNYKVDRLMELFTVGDDYVLDQKLVGADCAGSIAHARMLQRQGYLSPEDLHALEGGLREIFDRYQAGDIIIDPSQEDCHTFIEEELVASLGDAGRRIHLGRSRNDQVLCAIRLYGREYLLEIQDALYSFVGCLIDFADEHKACPMPGRTHLQLAMPSSVGLWAGAFAEELVDAAYFLQIAFDRFNRSPLGTAAGYGVPLNIDREYSSGLMGFPEVQNNVMAVQNSRGRLEAGVCDALDQAGLVFGKLAQDLMLYSLPEFAYFTLPDELCTGSSIMPQKKNPDGLELLRSRTAAISARAGEIKQIIRALPGGFNRDFQDTKGPFLSCLEMFLPVVRVSKLIFEKLTVHEDALRSAHKAEIFATDEAIRLVNEGMTFRDAYRHVAQDPTKLSSYDIDKTLQSRTSAGHPANLGLSAIRNNLSTFLTTHHHQSTQHYRALHTLLGKDTRLLPP